MLRHPCRRGRPPLFCRLITSRFRDLTACLRTCRLSVPHYSEMFSRRSSTASWASSTSTSSAASAESHFDLLEPVSSRLPQELSSLFSVSTTSTSSTRCNAEQTSWVSISPSPGDLLTFAEPISPKTESLTFLLSSSNSTPLTQGYQSTPSTTSVTILASRFPTERSGRSPRAA